MTKFIKCKWNHHKSAKTILKTFSEGSAMACICDNFELYRNVHDSKEMFKKDQCHQLSPVKEKCLLEIE